METGLFSKAVKCPLCNNGFNTTKVRKSACIVDSRDEDFCIRYKGLNPVFYDIFVCPTCGYAASEAFFDKLSSVEQKKLKEVFSGFKVARSFCNERTINDAIDSYKLALFTHKEKSSKDSVVAGTCLRLAWLYRMLQDKNEQVFLNYALEYYKRAYDIESFPIGNFDEITIQYLIGELLRRTGKYEEAVQWFSKAVANPERFNNPRIEKIAREQWALVKEQRRNLKKSETL